MRTSTRCRQLLLLASFCLMAACTTRGPKDRNDTVLENNKVKFSHTETKDDATFTALTIDDGLFQEEAARLAKDRTKTDDVQQLAELMLEDHQDSNKELRRIAHSLNISFPVALGNDNQKDLDDLRGRNGYSFDKAYTTMMVKKLQAMIDAFTRESQNGSEQTIRKWAHDKIIVLQMDLEMSTRAKAAVDRRR
jgi:putative membrane protein